MLCIPKNGIEGIDSDQEVVHCPVGVTVHMGEAPEQETHGPQLLSVGTCLRGHSVLPEARKDKNQ